MGSNDSLDEFSLRRLFEAKIEAFGPRAARGECPPQGEVEFPVAGEALEIVKDDNEVFVGLRVEIGQQRHHAGALHKISAPRHIVREDRFHVITVLGGILAAAQFLTIEAVAFCLLLGARHPAIDQCRLAGAGFLLC
nr:hypothetical protein [Maricaulis sp. W15]